MATTYVDYTGDGNATKQFSFPSIKEADIKVDVDGVIKTSGNHYNITSYTTTGGGNVVFTSGNIPASPASIRIYRDTDVDAAKATFVAGSSVKAGDLNNNITQILYASQEEQNQPILTRRIQDANITTAKIKDANVTTAKIAGDAITGAKIADDQINSEHYVDGSIDTAHIADSQITTAKIADSNVTTAKIADSNVTTAKIANSNVTTAKIADSNVTTAKIADSNVTTAKIAADAITAAKIADDVVNSEHYAAGSIDTEHIADGQVTHVKLANDAVDGDNISNDSINSEHYVDGSIDTAHIADSQITTAKIANDNVTTGKLATDSVTTLKILDANVTTAKIADSAVTTAKIADDNVTTGKLGTNSVTTLKITDANVTTAKIADGAVTTAKLGNDAVTTGKIGANQVTTAKIADSNITTAKIASDAITGAKIADDAVDSEHLAADSIDAEHYAAASVDATALASNAVTTAKITDANVTTVKVADSNITLAKLASDLKQTSISDSDTQLPTSGAVVDYVAAQIAPLGGLEVVATEVAFPNTQPASGVVISISDAGGVVVNGSGVSTTGRTVGGSTVTINNFPSSLQNKTMAAGVGLMVSSTGSSQTYNYHKLLAKEADVEQLSNDINDFAARYRVGSSNPTSDNDAGDLFFNTGSNKLLVYNSTNSAWEETQTVGNFFINTISSSSGTGGGSATFNGSAYRFTISNAGTYAQQHLVSINGVIQKPNTGTSQPSEGFAIDGGDIIFSSAPASGADYFIITIGASVSIGTPTDGTVTTAKLASGAVTTAKLADANVTTAKIADDAVTAAKLASDAVVTASIVDDAVTSAKIADDAVVQAAIADASVDEARLQISNSPTNGYFLQAQSGNTGGLTWAQVTTDLVGDTSPQLGGNLDSNGNNIILGDSSSSNDDRLQLGAGSNGDLEIFHDGSSSYIDNKEGDLYIRCTGTDGDLFINVVDDIVIKTNNGGTDTLRGYTNGGVDLYYDGTKRFATHSEGTYHYGHSTFIIGDEGESAQLFLHADDGDDNADKWKIVASAGGPFYLQNYTSGSWESNLIAYGNGGVELYHDNSKKFETFSWGARVTGNFDATGSVDSNEISINGTTVLNSSRSLYNLGKIELADNIEARFGSSNDLKIYHDGSSSYISNTTGNLYIEAKSGETAIQIVPDGAVDLRYDGSKKLQTYSGGVEITGNYLYMGDGVEVRCGGGSDLRLYHNGTHSYVQGYNTGNLYVGTTHSANLILVSNNSGRWSLSTSGHLLPEANNTYNIGSSSYRVANVYTNDLHLSNEGSSNDVDGTWGDWTMQEGESDLFLKNNRSGKKYKFNLTEVS